MDAEIFVVTYFVVGVIMGVLCAWVASERGRSAGGWFILRLLLGIFAFIPLAMIPTRPREYYNPNAGAPSAAAARRRIREEQGYQPPNRQRRSRSRGSEGPSPVDDYIASGQRKRNQERRAEIQRRRNAGG